MKKESLNYMLLGYLLILIVGSFGFTVDNGKDMMLILENAINAFKIVNIVDYTQMPLYTNN